MTGAALGARLRELRERSGWSQVTLSRASGVSEATIRAIEGSYPNSRRRTRATLTALSRAFGLPNEHLSGYQDGPAPEGPAGRRAAAGAAGDGQPGGKDWPGVIGAIRDRVRAEHLSDAELAWRTRLAHGTVVRIWAPGSEFTEAALVCFSVALGWPPHYLVNILHRQPPGGGEPGYPWPDSFGTRMLGLLGEIRREIGAGGSGGG